MIVMVGFLIKLSALSFFTKSAVLIGWRSSLPPSLCSSMFGQSGSRMLPCCSPRRHFACIIEVRVGETARFGSLGDLVGVQTAGLEGMM
jgi:hypothetical protein